MGGEIFKNLQSGAPLLCDAKRKINMIGKVKRESHAQSHTLGCLDVYSSFVAGGIIVGSFIVKKLPLKNIAKKATFICALSSLITIGGSLGFLLPGCRTTVMAGTTTPYTNRFVVSSITFYLHCVL